jgi:tetratricopeptide (TPR) repeat protein
MAAKPVRRESGCGPEPANAHCIHCRPIVLGALRSLVVLSVIGGFSFQGGGMRARAAVPQPRHDQPLPPASQPQSLRDLPSACLEPDMLSLKAAQVLSQLRDNATAGAWNALGALYAQRGALTCAIPSFQMALRLQPDSPEARYNLALAWIKSGEPARATRELKTLLRQNPRFAGAHYALGILLQGNGKPAAAQSEFEAVIRSDPHFFAAYLNLAEILDRQRRYPAAISHLKQALALNPPPDVAGQLQATLDKTYAERQRFQSFGLSSSPDSAVG